MNILRRFHPGLLLVHLTKLDDEQHAHGPFSPQAKHALERIDTQISRIEQQAEALDRHARIAIVSDHGFSPVRYHVNINVLLAKAGLIRLEIPRSEGSNPAVRGWQAEAWACGGSDAIMLRQPSDPHLARKVLEVLARAKADGRNGIRTILTHEEIVRRGGNPMASFLVDFADGYAEGGAFRGPTIRDARSTGTHGYLPQRRSMRASFMVVGYGVAPGRKLGVIDMRRIAPTLAGLLGLNIPGLTELPLSLMSKTTRR